MAEAIIQTKNKNGDNLYPITLASAVLGSTGKNVDVSIKEIHQKIDSIETESNWTEVQ